MSLAVQLMAEANGDWREPKTVWPFLFSSSWSQRQSLSKTMMIKCLFSSLLKRRRRTLEEKLLRNRYKRGGGEKGKNCNFANVSVVSVVVVVLACYWMRCVGVMATICICTRIERTGLVPIHSPFSAGRMVKERHDFFSFSYSCRCVIVFGPTFTRFLLSSES